MIATWGWISSTRPGAVDTATETVHIYINICWYILPRGSNFQRNISCSYPSLCLFKCRNSESL